MQPTSSECCLLLERFCWSQIKIMTTGTIKQLARAIPWGTCLLAEQSEALGLSGPILLAILWRGTQF